MVYSLVLTAFRRLSSVVEQHFRKVEVPGSNPGGGSKLKHVFYIGVVRWIIVFSIVIQIALWWIRSTYIDFNPLALTFGLGILVCNIALVVLLEKRDMISSLILSIGSGYVQLLLLILLIASRGNA